MTQLSTRGRMRLRRELDNLEEQAEESSELNLVPYLDIITNILMFLLVTVTSVLSLGNLETIMPSRSRSASMAKEQPPQEEKPPLNLTVAITDTGFNVAGSGGVLYENDIPGKIPTVPKLQGDKYNFDGLQKLLVKIKKEYPKEEQVILSANPNIQYEIVIGTMDVLRMGPEKENLFPLVLFSTGIQ